jgi:hypothetical protein
MSSQNRRIKACLLSKNRLNEAGTRLNPSLEVLTAATTVLLKTKEPIDGVLPSKGQIVRRVPPTEERRVGALPGNHRSLLQLRV